MKAQLTAITLATTLVSGTALADSNNVQQGQLTRGTIIEVASHYDSVEQITIDRANLPAGNQDPSLYRGSK